MKKTVLIFLLAVITAFGAAALTGCGGQEETSGDSGQSTEAAQTEQTAAEEAALEDGTYVVKFTTDNAMFHVSEANEDKGLLTVKDGKMTVHVSLQSKKIVNLFPGTAEDAQKEGAQLLEPTTDTVTYSDGYTEEVYGFDVPVPAIDQEFDLALIGTKGKWYDHKVMVSDPVPGDDIHAQAAGIDLEDGTYSVNIAMEGGTGKASIETPAEMTVADGQATLTVTWSSPHYDYMLVDGEKFEPVNEEGNSVFEIPVKVLDEPFTVIGDTTAMSQPHEIEYQLTCTLAE